MERATQSQQTIRMAYAELLDTVADMDRSDTAKDAGYSRLTTFLVELLHIAPSKALRMVRQSEQIREDITPTGHVMPAVLPTVREALQGGLGRQRPH